MGRKTLQRSPCPGSTRSMMNVSPPQGNLFRVFPTLDSPPVVVIVSVWVLLLPLMVTLVLVPPLRRVRRPCRPGLARENVVLLLCCVPPGKLYLICLQS